MGGVVRWRQSRTVPYCGFRISILALRRPFDHRDTPYEIRNIKGGGDAATVDAARLIPKRKARTRKTPKRCETAGGFGRGRAPRLEGV